MDVILSLVRRGERNQVPATMVGLYRAGQLGGESSLPVGWIKFRVRVGVCQPGGALEQVV